MKNKPSLPDVTFFFVVLFLSFAALTVEIFLQTLFQTSFCGTSACRVVGEYVHFGELALIQFGAVFFGLLLLFSFFSMRYPRNVFLSLLLQLCLYGSAAFDGALLGFQFVQLKTPCLLCIGVGLALLFTFISYAWWKKKWQICVLALAVWCGGFAANSLLVWNSMGGDVPELKESVLLETDAAVSGDFPAYHLFFSMSCSHCSDLFVDLSVNNELLIDEGNWYLHPLDSKKEDLARLTVLSYIPEARENIFYAVLQAKQINQDELPLPDPAIRLLTKKSYAFFSAGGYSGVPLLIVKVNPMVTLVFQGNDAIMNWLNSQGVIERRAVPVPDTEQPE